VSLALLIHSTEPCEGPVVATRHFESVKASGLAEGDVVEIADGNGLSLEVKEDGVIALPSSPQPLKVKAFHREASGNPITVELV
jgi:hypothetical protein